jgi:DnaJ-class molecular chaperone
LKEHLSIFEAAILLKMSPTLIQWLTSYAPKSNEIRKLPYEMVRDGEFFFNAAKLNEFNKYLSEPWPCNNNDQRPTIPEGFKTEIKKESHFRCALCNHPHGEYAHIDPVHNSKNNHPHNLIYLCANCHGMYDIEKTITRKQIFDIKKELLHSKVIIWKSHTKLIDCISSLIKEIERISKQEILSEELTREAIKELLLEIKSNAEREFDTSTELEKDKVETVNVYKKKISQIIENNEEVEDKLVFTRLEYLGDIGKAECPLCHGSGIHNNWECPVCRGTGTVDEAASEHIDLSPYEQIECPLCNGSGSHNRWECPVCRGTGTVDEAALEHIDLSPYEQIECPLCNGSGSHNRWECPVCRGTGTVDEAALEHIDLSPYEQIECPLCHGSGSHNRWECHVCRGTGTVDEAALEHIDLSPYEQIECPLCKGSGVHNNWECPICSGTGSVDEGRFDDIDISPFQLVE